MADEMRVDDGGGREKLVRLDYPSNAKNAKQEPQPEKKVEQVVTGKVIKRKRSPFAKLTQNFVVEDSTTVLEHLISDVLVPAAKSLVVDMITEGLQRKLYGDSRPRTPAQRTYTSYSTRSAAPGGRHIPGSASNVTPLSRIQKANHDFRDIILVDRGDAEDVLDRLRDLINQYKLATVNDFYELIGLSGEFTDDKWGWYDLRSASIRPVNGGWAFNMPRTMAID
jgi:hypothetical protein